MSIPLRMVMEKDSIATRIGVHAMMDVGHCLIPFPPTQIYALRSTP